MASNERYAALRTKLLDANPDAVIEGVEQLPSKAHYLTGNSPDEWRRNVPTYRKVKAGQVYPGIDVIYYGRQGHVEYDFVLAPGASVDRIRLAFSGCEQARLDQQGNLLLEMGAGTVVQRRPELYQVVDGARRTVEGAFQILECRPASCDPDTTAVVGFRVEVYDPRYPLTIDPVLSYSAYLGGGDVDAEHDSSVAVDAEGYVYVAGLTASVDFPLVNAIQTENRGGMFAGQDAFVTKLTPDGSSMVFCTYFGGTGDEHDAHVALTPGGNVAVAGTTSSGDFPTTTGALKRIRTGALDVFVTELNTTGSSLLFSTFLGGSARDWGRGITVGSEGSLYVTGMTESEDYPTNSGAFQTEIGGNYDAFLTKMAPNGQSLVFSSFLGGTSYDDALDVAVSPNGETTVCGMTSSAAFPLSNPIQDLFQGGFPAGLDGFVSRFDASGSALQYSTYLAGDADEACTSVVTDANGSAYVVGTTASTNFPTTQGAFSEGSGVEDGFVARLNPTGTALEYCTLVGGMGWDGLREVELDELGCAWAVGSTASQDFPLAGATQIGPGGLNDGVVLQLSADGSSLQFSTYLGGSGEDVAHALALGPAGSIWVVGSTGSANFPKVGASQPTYGGGSRDAFVARYGPPTFSVSGTVLEGDAPLPGVSISVGNRSAQTDAEGEFEVSGLVAGDYTVTPSATEYSFTPASRTVALGPSRTADFAAGRRTYEISGQVTENGQGVSGVSVRAGTQSTVTTLTGAYVITGLPAGTYEVAPEKSGLVFTPPNYSVSVGPTASARNFTANSGPYLQSLTLVAGAIQSKGKTQGTLALNRPVPGKVTITVQSNHPAVGSFRVKLGKGTASKQFKVKAQKVISPAVVELSASYGGVTQKAVLTVNP